MVDFMVCRMSDNPWVIRNYFARLQPCIAVTNYPCKSAPLLANKLMAPNGQFQNLSEDFEMANKGNCGIGRTSLKKHIVILVQRLDGKNGPVRLVPRQEGKAGMRPRARVYTRNPLETYIAAGKSSIISRNWREMYSGDCGKPRLLSPELSADTKHSSMRRVPATPLFAK